jgi:hypothetical protein
MKWVLKLAIIAITVWLMSSCNAGQWHEVREGLDASFRELPNLAEFEQVTVLRGENRMKSCFYAEAETVLGTTLAEEEALDAYVDKLKSSGWVETHRNERSRVLIRGEQERIRVTGYLSLSAEANNEYIRSKDRFLNFVSVSLTFYVPRRDGC